MRWPDECGGLNQRHNFLSKEIAQRIFFFFFFFFFLRNSFLHSKFLPLLLSTFIWARRKREWKFSVGIGHNTPDDTGKALKELTWNVQGWHKSQRDLFIKAGAAFLLEDDLSHLNSKSARIVSRKCTCSALMMLICAALTKEVPCSICGRVVGALIWAWPSLRPGLVQRSPCVRFHSAHELSAC